jgi:response regulator RpfG family c-di-GMP phosphodiesterase/serine/threonine protein kinase
MAKSSVGAPIAGARSTVEFELRKATGGTYLRELLVANLINAEDWERLTFDQRKTIAEHADRTQVLEQLVEYGLLTRYQAERIGTGATHGLVLGNYRVLDKIGVGGMAVVYKAEHLEMRHIVAIKVRPQYPDQDPRLDLRFSAEMRIVVRLRHPNIVAALDSGRVAGSDPSAPVYRYIVMEYVPGQNLEDHVKARGPLPPAKLCNIAYQVASALGEIHRFHFVHRDIKPTNILLTAEDQAKLLDFGLSRQVDYRLTQPGAVLGTIDYMAPEQGRDASKVDIRADIYSLGVTAFWCLTGRMPFPSRGSGFDDFLRRLDQAPPSVREFVPNCPAGLDAVIARMMAPNVDARFQTPQEVMAALLPYFNTAGLSSASLPVSAPPVVASARGITAWTDTMPAVHRALLVDDDAGVRELCRVILGGNDILCDSAGSGDSALQMAGTGYDLVLLDMELPGMSGREVLRKLREKPPTPNVKIIMLSGTATPDEMSAMLLAGADDYLAKPFSVVQLQGRVKAALRLKDAQDQIAAMNQHLMMLNADMERNLSYHDMGVRNARNSLVRLLTQIVYRRFSQDGAVALRVPRYCRRLAEAAARNPGYGKTLSNGFIETLVACAPLFDIGKVVLPDYILNKPGKLSAEEFILMQSHTTAGADLVKAAARDYGADAEFFAMAADVIRHHHEKWDGRGYPDKLAGNDIPLSARIVGLCNVYDALRARQNFRPALSHATALQLMRETFTGHFDPGLLQVFLQVAAEFEKISE